MIPVPSSRNSAARSSALEPPRPNTPRSTSSSPLPRRNTVVPRRFASLVPRGGETQCGPLVLRRAVRPPIARQQPMSTPSGSRCERGAVCAVVITGLSDRRRAPGGDGPHPASRLHGIGYRAASCRAHASAQEFAPAASSPQGLTTMPAHGRVARPSAARVVPGPSWSCGMSLSDLIALAVLLAISVALWVLTAIGVAKLI
jgi:hypothetical protein